MGIRLRRSTARPSPRSEQAPVLPGRYSYAAHPGRANIPIVPGLTQVEDHAVAGNGNTPLPALTPSACVPHPIIGAGTCAVCLRRLRACPSLACWVFGELHLLSVVKTLSTTGAVAIAGSRSAPRRAARLEPGIVFPPAIPIFRLGCVRSHSNRGTVLGIRLRRSTARPSPRSEQAPVLPGRYSYAAHPGRANIPIVPGLTQVEDHAVAGNGNTPLPALTPPACVPHPSPVAEACAECPRRLRACLPLAC